MKNFIRKLTGLEKEQEKLDADKKEVEKEKDELLSKRNPKEYATRKKQPWVGVLDVKVNEKNVRNGFFELDWNKYFIIQLIESGYGEEADPEEEIVDRWFKDIVYNMLEQEGQSTDRGAGYINVVPIDKGKSEIS